MFPALLWSELAEDERKLTPLLYKGTLKENKRLTNFKIIAYNCQGSGFSLSTLYAFEFRKFATCTSPIIHLVDPKVCIRIVFYVSWDDCDNQEN